MTNEGVTKAVATAAVTSPVWLPMLKQVSEIAGLLLPILGVLWFVIRAVVYFRDRRKPPKP